MEQIRECRKRRKIRLIEGNAIFRHLKKLTCKGTLRHAFICLRPRTPSPSPPLYTLQYTCVQYTCSHREVGIGGDLNQREGEGGNTTEPVLLNVYGAPELIPRNEFRQPM
jgi:hypothetical protein